MVTEARYFLVAAICVLAMLCLPGHSSGQPLQDRLPETPDLLHTVIDTGDWLPDLNEKLDGLYDYPLCVPRGELRHIEGWFEGFSRPLPWHPETLATFAPWGPDEQERFFRRWPELEALRPVLRFDCFMPLQLGEVTSAIRFDGNREASHQSCRIRLAPIEAIELHGLLDLSDHSARWKRRLVKIALGSNGGLQAGNFDPQMKSGLFYGYFPGDTAVSGPADNWLVGQARSWNGITAHVATPNEGSLSVFGHHRRSERIAGAMVHQPVMGPLEIRAALSTALTHHRSSKDTATTLHLGGSFTAAKWVVEVDGGACDRSPLQIPFRAVLRSRDRRHGWQACAVRIPDRFVSGRSRHAHRLRRKVFGVDSIHEGVYEVTARQWVRLGSHTRLSATGAWTGAGARGFIRMGVTASGGQTIDYLASYHHAHAAGLQRHRAKMRIEYPADSRRCLRFETSLYRSCTHRRITIGGSLHGLTVTDGLAVNPYCSMTRVQSERWQFRAGISSLLRPFERTSSRFTLNLHPGDNHEPITFRASFNLAL